ncbi:MAG: hypothetical protein ABI847_06880 [Anaerolineales bacterium]
MAGTLEPEPDEARRSLLKLRELARENAALVIFGHDGQSSGKRSKNCPNTTNSRVKRFSVRMVIGS